MITPKTNQEAFDIVWKGLQSQGWQRSLNNNDGCVLFSESGRRCAIGWLCSDDESKFVSAAVVVTRLVKSGVDREFCCDVMSAHDVSSSALGMKRNMRKVAETFGLTVPS